MFFRILKKDLKRKRTMNMILLLFIILASMFIASGVNNIRAVMTALDNYFEKSNIPDHLFSAYDEKTLEQYEAFAKENGYGYDYCKMVIISSGEVYIDGTQFDLNSTLLLSDINNSVKVFDSKDKEITKINDGEIYLSSSVFHSDSNDIQIGSQIKVTANGVTKTFTLKDYTKDVIYGSSMVGMTRFLISEKALAAFMTEDATLECDGYVYTDDKEYYKKFYDLSLLGSFEMDMEKFRLMYIMDLINAALILIVSICLILISMVILRFTIHFTIDEEFREIGVMKAIGLRAGDIRRLYIIKYLAISIVGAVLGFICSIPFGNILLREVSQNIIISGRESIFLNLLCAGFTAGIVIFFCYSCTRKIEKFSPIEAIRNGQNGERYSQKSMISLGRFKFSPISFLAINDILSGIRRFVILIIIFTLGMLLIIIPANTSNTLQSDHLIAWFNMAECNHVVTLNNLLPSSETDGNMLETLEQLSEDIRRQIKNLFIEKNIPADIFYERVLRSTVSYNGNKTSSLSFQGIGDVTENQYAYEKGTPPQNADEVAISGIIAGKIGADIGDEIEIENGSMTKKYTITALFQSMNNMGEGIRFYHDEELDKNNTMGYYGIQIRYKDNPDSNTLAKRKNLLKEHFSGAEIYTAGEYISIMIGNIAGQLQSVKILILLVVLCINILVTVLMVKSFLTKEKGEIALLKAIGFQNSSLVAWQTIRLGIVILLAVVLAVILSTPLSSLTVEPIFKMMGAQSITFKIKPLEVFVFYPLLIFSVTILSGLLTACQIRNIHASETANIE